ncbi:MCP four helix bundle domain-containing protein, partial [Blastococcus saxobsidens]
MNRTTRSHHWFADRPIALKLAAVVATMGLVSLVIAFVAVRGAHDLRDGEHRLYIQNVQPMDTLGAIQRSFQGDRVRIVSYNVADAETRAFLRENLAKRQTDLQALLDQYEGSQADDAAWAAVNEALTAYYANATRQMDAIDAGSTAFYGFNEEKPLASAVMDPYAVESDAQAAAAADEAAAGEDRAAAIVVQIVMILVIGLLAAGALAVLVVRMLTRTVRSVQKSVDALALGDLTVMPEVTAGDELGRMAASLGAAQESLRTVLSQVAGSADAVAASSEELSASSAQISAGAEETSAQSGV